MLQLLRKHWIGWNLRRHRAGDPGAMRRLHWVKDPWDLNSSDEDFRFRETTRIIKSRIGERFDSILEIGCGEGLQSLHLAPLATRFVGIDASPHGIKRAQARQIPNAAFRVGDLVKCAASNEERFCLVTGCEMIYYLPDLEEAYRALSRLGKICFVSYYSGVFERIDPFFRSKNVNWETLRYDSRQWRVVWWSSQGAS